MVLFGTEYWDADPAGTDGRKPLLPLLRQLAREKAFERTLLCTDSIDEIVAFLRAFEP